MANVFPSRECVMARLEPNQKEKVAILITSRMTARTSQTSKTVRGWSSSTNITGAFALQFSETKVKPCKSS